MSGLGITLAEAAGAMGARAGRTYGQKVVTRVSTDTRSIKKGDLFFALKGDNFNGHDYLKEAFRQGAAAAVVNQGKSIKGRTCLQVPDTLAALGDLAAFIRNNSSALVVAVTGSVGKTSTKEMMLKIIGSKFKVLGTEGNLNNLIGLPQTLFKLRKKHQVVVLELGMNRPGEIGRLTQIASPDVGVLTGVGPAHLEGVGSIEGTARAKGEMFGGMNQGSVAVFNLDDPLASSLAQAFQGKRVSFGFNKQADLTVKGLRYRGKKGMSFVLQTKKGSAPANLPLLGRHNVSNVLAASAAAVCLGLSPKAVAKAMADIKPFPGRLELKTIDPQVTLVDDSYNSNPMSAKAALDVLGKLKGRGRTVAVLGDMLELGTAEKKLHRDLGRDAAKRNLDLLAGFGPLSKHMIGAAKKAGMNAGRLTWFNNQNDLAAWLKKSLRPHDRVLVKASRGMHLERTIKILEGREASN